MKRSYFLVLLSMWLLCLIMSCGQSDSKEKSTAAIRDTANVTNDSLAIMQTFERLKTDKIFLKDLSLEDERQFSWNDNFYRIFRGDLNGDHKADALLGFVIEGRGGGNNSDVHYVALLNRGNQWKYSGQLDGSIFADDYFFEIQKIENAVIKGEWVGDKDESVRPYLAEYILKNGQIINIFTALHPTENLEREYLAIETVLTSENISIPLTGKVKEYEQILGKGRVTKPEENPDCGTYWAEEAYRFLEYPNLRFELNDKNEAAMVTVELKNGFTLQTDKGTINEHTRLEDLKNVFYKNDSWMMFDEENGIRTFAIPDSPESDNQWRLSFDRNLKLIRLSLFIPC